MLHIYWEVTTRHLRLFDKFRFNKTKHFTTLTFLLRCRDHITITCFLQYHHHIYSRAVNRIYQRTSLSQLREWIHHNRRQLDTTSREMLNTHPRIANQHSECDWALIDQNTLIKAKRVGENCKARQLKNSHGSKQNSMIQPRPWKNQWLNTVIKN